MGKYVGWFAPEYKFIAEAYREISVILANVKRSSSRDKVFTTLSGGRVDFWSLENELAGRSMGYHLIVIDEAAFTKAGMLEIWQKNLRPTLLDFAGRAIVCSNTNGVRVGDASLARDSLSAQGICSGLSDAASLVRGAGRLDHWADRQREQLTRHLRYLATVINRSRFHAESAWSDYRQFLVRSCPNFCGDG